MSRNGSDQFNDMGQVILISGIVFPAMRFKQVVTGSHFKGHASCRPNVGGRTVTSTEENFQTSILSSLNIFCEVMMLEFKKRNKYILDILKMKLLIWVQLSCSYFSKFSFCNITLLILSSEHIIVIYWLRNNAVAAAVHIYCIFHMQIRPGFFKKKTNFHICRTF